MTKELDIVPPDWRSHVRIATNPHSTEIENQLGPAATMPNSMLPVSTEMEHRLVPTAAFPDSTLPVPTEMEHRLAQQVESGHVVLQDGVGTRNVAKYPVESVEQLTPSDGPQRTKKNRPTKRKICKYCDKQFARHSLMLNHERIHTMEKPFECKICFTAFREKQHLLRHQRVHTTEKCFVCHQCGQKFKYEKRLSRHLLKICPLNK